MTTKERRSSKAAKAQALADGIIQTDVVVGKTPADDPNWKATDIVHGVAQITLSDQDKVHLLQAGIIVVHMTIECEHAVGRTRERPTVFSIVNVPVDPSKVPYAN